MLMLQISFVHGSMGNFSNQPISNLFKVCEHFGVLVNSLFYKMKNDGRLDSNFSILRPSLFRTQSPKSLPHSSLTDKSDNLIT